MTLTATKLPDGEMYLRAENPHGKCQPVSYGDLMVTKSLYDDFARTHPPILAPFKCTDGQRFEDGVDVEKVDQFQGHKDWHTCQNITIEMAKENNWPTRQVYTLKSDKGGEKKELKAELDYGVKVDFGHYENGGPYLTIYDEKDTFLFGNDCIVKLRDFLNQLPFNPPQP